MNEPLQDELEEACKVFEIKGAYYAAIPRDFGSEWVGEYEAYGPYQTQAAAVDKIVNYTLNKRRENEKRMAWDRW